MKDLLPVIIEAVIFMIPIATLFVKIGKYQQQIDDLNKKIDKYDNIDNRLTAIETKIDLLLSGKLTTNEK